MMSLVSISVKNIGMGAMARGAIRFAAVGLIVAGLPTAAWAGGVIIHGHQPAGSFTMSTPGAEDDVPDDPKTAEERAREQEIYLWAASIFNGHIALSDLTREDLDDPVVRERVSYMLAEAEAEETEGGCAAAPTTTLSALAGLGLLLRRKRSR